MTQNDLWDWYEVSLFPIGTSALVYAPDVIVAAEITNQAFGPAREAMITYNYSNPIPEEISTRVPLNQPRPAVHFVGFRGEEFWSAVRVWGFPDIVHRVWDYRAQAEIAPGDVAVFAKYHPSQTPSEFSFNDSEVF